MFFRRFTLGLPCERLAAGPWRGRTVLIVRAQGRNGSRHDDSAIWPRVCPYLVSVLRLPDQSRSNRECRQMSTATQFTPQPSIETQPAHMLDGSRLLTRGAQRLVGVAMIAAAIGLWVMPGSSFDSDLLLFKLLLSIVAGLVAIGLLQSAAPKATPYVEIDTVRREVRLMRNTRSEAAELVQRCPFEDLSKVEREGVHLRMWDAEGVFLAEVAMTEYDVFERLSSALRDSGKTV